VPVREVVAVLAAIVSATLLLAVPLAGDTVIHGSLDDAVQEQPVRVVTATLAELAV
jgi:hypothetical protein